MTGTGNEDFDLPRWQTHHLQDTLSSSAQAAQAAQQAPFTNSYNAAPPPPPQSSHSANPAHRLPTIVTAHHSGHSASTRQPRISQLLDEEQQLGPHPFLSTGQAQLSRSASLGGAVGTTGGGSLSARGRRQHQPDDLERAFSSDIGQASPGPRPQQQLGASQQYPTSLYPSSVAYHQSQPQHQMSNTAGVNPASPSTGGSGDLYQDTYFSSPGHGSSRRSRTQHEQSSSSRSPRRSVTGQPTPAILDTYVQQPVLGQTQYSPSTGAYQYTSPTETQSAHPSSTYHSHSHSHSLGKNGPSTSPMASPYTPQNALPPPPPQATSYYPSSYPMDTTSPAPPPSSQTPSHHLTSLTPMSLRHISVSTPSTPLSYNHPQNQSQGPYNAAASDPSTMAVEVPHKRRASGLKRVRDSRDLRPQVNGQPSGRRDDGSGTFLSVRLLFP